MANYRRGVHQRLRAKASEGDGVPTSLGARSSQGDGEPSALANLLMQKWAWGELPATAVQELAAAALHDGAKHAQIRRHILMGV